MKKLEKYGTADTPYVELFQTASWGKLEAELGLLANDYHKLMNQLIEIQKEGRSLGNREREAYLKWMGLARGKKINIRQNENFGYTQDKLFAGAKLDKNRDNAIYRLLLKERTLELAHEKMNDRIIKTGGRIFLHAVKTEDGKHLRVLKTFVELVKRKEPLSDPGLFKFFLLIGEDADGKLKRKTKGSLSLLSRGCKRDRKTIRQWCKHYEVSPTCDKRGPRKKS